MLETSPLNPSTTDQADGRLTDQEHLVLTLYRRVSEEQQMDILRFLEAFAKLPELDDSH